MLKYQCDFNLITPSLFSEGSIIFKKKGNMSKKSVVIQFPRHISQRDRLIEVAFKGTVCYGAVPSGRHLFLFAEPRLNNFGIKGALLPVKIFVAAFPLI